MGYTLKIGEAKIVWDVDFVNIDCDLVSMPDAPAFGEITDFENQRHPSYTAWADSMRSLGLYELMNEYVEYDGGYLCPLIGRHPGASPITQNHVNYVVQKIAEYKAKNPDHIAQYPPLKDDAKPFIEGSGLYSDDQYVDDPRFDGSLCRGEWLLYWMKWAVENCEKPVLVNR